MPVYYLPVRLDFYIRTSSEAFDAGSAMRLIKRSGPEWSSRNAHEPLRLRRAVSVYGREPVGHRARRLFRHLIRHTQREHSWRQAYWPGMPVAIELGRWLYYWWLAAPSVERKYRISRWHQLLESWQLMWREHMHTQLYYMFELYRPEERDRVGEYLTRWETKNGLVRALNCIAREGRGKQTDLGDKLRFTDLLLRHGLPGIPLLLSCEAGAATPAAIDPVTFERDVFLKTRYGKGAEGAMCIRYLGSGRYDYEGRTLSLDELVAVLVERSASAALIVLPRLRNHPALADLAEESLITLRVFTCLNETGVPEVVMAMLRILGKLEPRWHTETEWAAPIDLPTGRLRALAGDMPDTFVERYPQHPVNGQPVAGRLVPLWPEVCRIAVAAHRVIADRMIAGWDIAVTPDGPAIIEANALPDVVFLQRVHQTPIGHNRLGELMAHHLDRLEQHIDLLPSSWRR